MVVTSIFITLPKLLKTSTINYNFGNEQFYFPSELLSMKLKEYYYSSIQAHVVLEFEQPNTSIF
jgi:hypothetical protein